MSHIDPDAIRAQLERITASTTFQQVDRLKRFLIFVVQETVAGRGGQLKEYVIGVQVFDKDVSFDPRTDPIVRVQARRLRVRLARYYKDEGHSDSLLIELPKGGYTPTFRKVEVQPARRSISGTLASRNTVTVAPFEDQSPAADLGYFCGGLGQEIVHALVTAENVRVLAWEDRSGDGAKYPEAAMLVTGSVRRASDALRVTAQIVDGASRAYLWSQTFDGSLETSLDLQERVAADVRGKLQFAAAGSDPARRGFRRPIENLAARNLYLQGRYHLNQRTEDGLRRAVDFFEKALNEDSQHAQASSGLADAYSLLGHYGVLSPAEVWTKAASSAAAAVMLDENSAEARTSLAHVKCTQDWDWAGAEQEFLRAISLDARYATAHHWYAVSCLAPMARLDEALEEILIAQSLDPVSSIIAREIAVIQYYRRDFEAALEQIDHTVELNPHFSPAYWTLGLIQEQRGEFDEATAAFERATQLSPNSPRMRGALGRTMALSGKKRQATRILTELKELAGKRYVSPFDIASLHFALGETEDGYEWLERAFRDRCFELLSILVDPRFDGLREDERFQRLSAQLGLSQERA